jgi:hypothetical protein
MNNKFLKYVANSSSFDVAQLKMRVDKLEMMLQEERMENRKLMEKIDALIEHFEKEGE